MVFTNSIKSNVIHETPVLTTVKIYIVSVSCVFASLFLVCLIALSITLIIC
jgi:hypothetical protein